MASTQTTRVIRRLECGRCGGLSESYARPGRCVDDRCDGPMVERRYVPAVVTDAMIERGARALDHAAAGGLDARRNEYGLQDWAEAVLRAALEVS